MAPFPEHPIQRMTSMQEGKHWLPPHAELLEGTPNSKIAARRYQSLLKYFERFLRPPRSLIDLSHVQIKLRVVVPYSESLQTKLFGVIKELPERTGEDHVQYRSG